MEKVCAGCAKTFPATTEFFHKHSSCRFGVTSRCKTCSSSINKAYYRKNSDRVKAAVKKYADENRDKVRAGNRIASAKFRNSNREAERQRLRKYLAANRERHNDRNREWRRNNPHKHAAMSGKRRARKLQATPPWANPKYIQLFYEMARTESDRIGTPVHVDHIVPLRSKRVCGLHCEHNLQLLTAEMNLSKSNKVWPDM